MIASTTVEAITYLFSTLALNIAKKVLSWVLHTIDNSNFTFIEVK